MPNGYFLIADITGYTRFMTASELDHAQGILEDLFAAILQAIDSPLTISNFQGDAVLCYAPDDRVADGGNIVEAVDAVYCAFSQRLSQICLQSTCQCTACRLAPELDLKFFVHHGVYALQKLAGRTEIAGPDVILVHRLAKNSVKDKTGLQAYAVFTDAAIAAGRLQEFAQTLTPHVETYEHVGPVSMVVRDLKKMAQERDAGAQCRVNETDSLLVPAHDIEVPLPMALAWKYLTDGELVPMWWAGVTSFRTQRVTGQPMGRGTQLHCWHGKQPSNMEILHWRPPHEMTTAALLPMGVRLNVTHAVVAVDDKRSRVIQRVAGQVYGGSWLGRLVFRLLTHLVLRPKLLAALPIERQKLLAVTDDHARRLAGQPDAAEGLPVREAVQASLATVDAAAGPAQQAAP